MAIGISVTIDKAGLAALESGPMKRAVVRALRKAGATALRNMRAEASKRIRQRKRIASKYISRALTLRRASGTEIASMKWSLEVDGTPVPLIGYPTKQTKQGVVAEINRGKKTLIRGAFAATMANGHEGVFRRRGAARLPIDELRGSRPIDALLHAGEAEGVAERGSRSFGATFSRVLEIRK